MTFLRIIKSMPKRDLLWRSPAGFSVVGTPAEIPIVVKFDEDDLKKLPEEGEGQRAGETHA